MTNLKTLTINMTDLFTEKEIIRTVDISVIQFDNGTCWEVAKMEENQRRLIEKWIEDRANDQHDTILTLNSWVIN